MSRVRIPESALGADMGAGKVVEWLAVPGDTAHGGASSSSWDTEKSMIDIECFDSRAVQRLLVPVGEKVPVGTPLAVIGAGTVAEAPPARVGGPAARGVLPEAGPSARAHSAAAGPSARAGTSARAGPAAS